MFKKGDLVTCGGGLGVCISEKKVTKTAHGDSNSICVLWYVKPQIWKSRENSFYVNFDWLKKAKKQ